METLIVSPQSLILLGLHLLDLMLQRVDLLGRRMLQGSDPINFRICLRRTGIE